MSHKKFFGSSWFEKTEKEQEEIWHILYFFDNKDLLQKYAMEHWGFDEDKAMAIANFNLKDGYTSLSRKAISNILPFLKRGFNYDIAVVLGGIKNAFGKDWQELPKEDKQFLRDNVPDIVRSGIKGGFIEDLKKLLKKEYELSDKQLKKLYHHSTNIQSKDKAAKLPIGAKADKQIQQLRNPIVVTALFELRKLVNELIDTYGAIDEIKVEMARDLKVSKGKRNKIRLEQQRLERENDRVKAEVEKYTRITHENILKYKLWEECKNTCPYTGRQIPIAELFSGQWQIEHIHPWSRSLNDSFMNKTLCEADENRNKGNKTPFEYYGNDEANWAAIKERALKLFADTKQYPNAYQKFKRFVQQKFEDDFTTRQLNDTRYISREAKEYLKQVCDKVTVAPGQMTSNLRHYWGLNSVLNDENKKTREDHRHHAIDALVMACSKVSYLQELSRWNRYDRQGELREFPLPWAGFRYDTEQAVEQILVSHKKKKNVITKRYFKTEKNGETFKNLGVAARGQLHKETVFGKRSAPHSEEAFHIRKPIDSLSTEKQLEKVVDEKIKELIFKRIHHLGGFVKGKIPEGTFFIVDEEGVKQPQIFLPNKNGKPVPVKKVRMKENIGCAEQLKDDINQWVNPRNNHHVLIYLDNQGNLKEEVITFWTAVERKRTGQSAYQLPSDGKEIVTTLQINDMFLLGLQEDEIDWEYPDYNLVKEHLYRVQKLSSKFYEFRLNTQASIKNNYAPYYVRIQSFGEGKTGWFTFNPIKVKVTASGKIEKI